MVPSLQTAFHMKKTKENYTGAMDASFGSGLQAAVKTFQKAVGLKADGFVGAETWYKLFS